MMLMSAPAMAQEASFEELLGSAKSSYEAEDYNKAIEYLIAANQLEPNSRLLLNIARSYAKAEDCASALGYYNAYTRTADAEESLVETANEESEELECSDFDATSVAGRVVFTSTPPGSAVKMDGKQIGVTPFEKVNLAKGIHKFEFSLEGYDLFEKDLQLAANTDLAISETLVETKVVEVVVPEEPVKEAPPEKDMTMYYAAGATAGVGVILLGVGLTYDLVLIPGTDDDRAATEPGTPEYNELTDTRSSQSSIAVGSYIAGAVLTVGGAAWLTYLFLTEDESDSSSSDAIEKSIGIVPVVGNGTVGLGMFGSF